MKLNKDGFLARCLKKNIEKEKRRNLERPAVPFINEKKQMWYFLMNQMDKKSAQANETQGETQE